MSGNCPQPQGAQQVVAGTGVKQTEALGVAGVGVSTTSWQIRGRSNTAPGGFSKVVPWS